MTEVTPRGATAGLIIDHGMRRRIDRGSAVFREGDAGTLVYAVVSGQVKLTMATRAGRDLLVAMKSPGEAFGELAALDGRARSATATATRATELSVLDGAAFVRLLETRTPAAIELLRRFAADLRATDQRVAASAGDRTLARAARQLLELSHRYAEHSGDRGAVELAISQEELAAWLGTTRESAARALAKLREAGCVTTGRGRVTITDVSTLQRFTAP